ncbi:MAG: DMT family transporter [Spirochaetaceae bacterium]|jgi:drug/metabolite transporter (DMT)-like permease|nr:DMT family transporter [Spirochaetaceae bacterium]
MREFSGKWAIVITALLWSTSGLSIKFLDWHPIIIAGGRSFFAAVFMIAVRLLFGSGGGAPLRRTLKTPAFWGAGLSYSATMLLFVVANKLSSSANVILLQYSAPVWTAILAWIIIKEKPKPEHWGGMALVFAGFFVFFKDALGNGTLSGDTLAVASGVAFAASSVFLRMMQDGNPADGLICAHIISALFCIPFIILYPPQPEMLNLKSALTILYMGFVQIGAASLLYSYGMKKISAMSAMLIFPIEPILNPIWVLLVMNEIPPLQAIAGGAIIIFAVFATNVVGIIRERRGE